MHETSEESTVLNSGNKATNKELGPSIWYNFKSSKKPLIKLKIRKRASRKSLGDKCVTFSECPPIALCMGGICSCPYDYYSYAPLSQPEMAVCRKKIKFGFFCSLSEDCLGYDSNSLCSDGICKCINGTHYIGSRNLLPYHKRCYKILEREGDVCEIDEQCSRLADNHHKCRCVGRCDCASINRYAGCSICHENIKRTFFGGAAFIVILLSSRVFSKMRTRTSSRQQQNIALNGTRERCYRLNTSRTVPSVSYTRSNLRSNRHITTSLPDVFLIESHSLIGIHSSNTTDFYPQTSPSTTDHSGERNEDAPPSYEDIVGDDRVVWNEPPPAYHEVTAKSP
ncbi:uncharacterized protein LOC129228574 [Uloborus diversus]|uniref:uncharacterized protein LOC129228574 n=1 Tax=Uloborus diversus TaxID=327109 RepID=UPI00240A4CC8|nr:uncharacterized protein LOC129228574 [Uloborus diversus]